jgi:hypothetical protein
MGRIGVVVADSASIPARDELGERERAAGGTGDNIAAGNGGAVAAIGSIVAVSPAACDLDPANG